MDNKTLKEYEKRFKEVSPDSNDYTYLDNRNDPLKQKIDSLFKDLLKYDNPIIIRDTNSCYKKFLAIRTMMTKLRKKYKPE